MDAEATISRHAAVVMAVEDLLRALGVDEDEHTHATPERVSRYWAEALAGNDSDPAVHLDRTFPGPADPGLVIVAGIEVRSTCAHHLLPISGVATVAYRARRGCPIVGLSKLARVVDGYARRLQVQERLGRQVADAVQGRLSPVGAGCVITATHGCMTGRGVTQPATATTTYALTGEWDPHHADVHAMRAAHTGTPTGWPTRPSRGAGG